MNNAPQRSYSRISGFRLGIYVFRDAEIVDYAAPFGVFSVARRFDPELDAFLIAEAMRPVQTQAGFTVVPNYSFLERPTMNAFLIPGGFGTRQEMHNGRLHAFVGSLPESTLLTSVCTGSWIYGAMGLLDGKAATNRKEPDRLEASNLGKVPIDRLAEIAPACRISHARVVDTGRIVTAGGIASGMEHEARRQWLRRVHAAGVLYGQQGDTHAVNAALVKGLQVGLNAGAARRIRPSDGQGNRRHARCSDMAEKKFSSHRMAYA